MHQEIEYDQAPAELRQQADAAVQTSNEPSPEVLRGRALVDQGMKAFGESRWADTIEALRQALAFLPNDPAICKTLTMAQMALHYEEMAAKSDQEAARRAAEDSVRVGIDIERLSDALSALRLEASEALVDQGRFESAVGLSERTDFLFDSSVVDLRQARQGIVIFEGMGEAISYRPSAEERQDRFSDPVTRAVADRLGIPLGSATPEERAYVERKTREVWEAYDRSKAAQAAATSDVAKRSVEAFKELIGRLESQGILKPGENVLAKEKSDPTFRALMRSEVKAIVLEDNVGRRETARSSFDKLLGDVASVLERRGTR
jgi:tetratricopeptide (TPR) repeat protein